MNIITRASVKERIHVEQIIRSQPHMHNSGLVDIVTIPVRHQEEVEHFLEENCQWYGRGHRHSIPFKVIVSVSSGRKVLWENPLFGK